MPENRISVAESFLPGQARIHALAPLMEEHPVMKPARTILDADRREFDGHGEQPTVTVQTRGWIAYLGCTTYPK